MNNYGDILKVFEVLTGILQIKSAILEKMCFFMKMFLFNPTSNGYQTNVYKINIISVC